MDEGLSLDERYGKLKELVRTNFSTVTQDLVDKALVYADRALAGYRRYDGKPLLDHSVRVAEIVGTPPCSRIQGTSARVHLTS